MKLLVVICLILFSSARAWQVDKRCLREGQLLVGDEAERLFDNQEVYEAFELDDEVFDWETLSFLDPEYSDYETEYEYDSNGQNKNLRGSNQMFQNETSFFSNATRKLQSGRTFNLKLTWRPGYCWQDEWRERKWCMACRGSCNSGEVLQIKSCSKSATQRFQWSGGRLKTASRNMCLTRSGGLRLRPCGGSGQNFRGYQSSGGFQLKPTGSSQCLTQQHHPKSGEIIELQSCGLAASHKTDKWNVYWPSGSGGDGGSGGSDGGGSDGGGSDGGGDNDSGNNNNNDSGGGSKLTKISGGCTNSKPCGKCEGDCDSDSQCKSGLKCFQRSGNTRTATVPGCSGSGIKGLDYCY